MPKQNDEDTILLRLATLAKRHTLFIKDNERRAYGKIEIDGIKHIYPLRSSMYVNWLSALFFATNKKIASTNLLDNAIQYLEGLSLFEAKIDKVGLRVLGDKDSIEIDLGNDDWTSVQINKDGWKIDEHVGHFCRNSGMGALPTPFSHKNRSIEFLSVIMGLGGTKEEKLIIAWLLGCFMPNGPFPLLVLQGEQGSGKSNLASMLRSLVDPTNTDKTTLPSSERDFYVQGFNNYMLCYDNQRTLRKHQSDWLCRMSTGGGYSTRKLYSNHDQESFSMTRPMMLNGISHIVDQPDLIDRSLIINLKTISKDKRKAEGDVRDLFNAMRPAIFGRICDGLVAILRSEEKDPEDLPRMADFARFVAKAETEYEWPQGDLILAMNESRKEALDQLNEYDTFLSMIVELSEDHKDHEFVFLGTPTELFKYLVEKLPSKASRSVFPESPASLSKRLNMLKPVLREKGIGVEDRRSNGKRLKKLYWL